MEIRRSTRTVLAVALVAVGAAVAGVVVWLWQSSQDRVYESTSVLVVEPAPSTLGAAGGRPENVVFLARTYAARASAQPVLAEAITRSGLDVTEEDAAELVSVAVSNQDATITLRARGASPEEARALNLALTDSLVEHVSSEQVALRDDRLEPLREQIDALEARLSGLSPDSAERLAAEQQYQALIGSLAEAEIAPVDSVAVLSPPTEPEAPISPRPLRAALLAFLVAGVIGLQVVVGLRLLRQPDRGTWMSDREH